MKRFLSLVLAIVLLSPVFPTPTDAITSTDDIRTVVAQAYDDLKATTNPGEGSGEGVMQLVNHAIAGGGSTLVMDETDYFTGMVFHSNMFRDAFIDCLTASFERLTKSYDQKLLMIGFVSYYDHNMLYTGKLVSHFPDIRDLGQSAEDPEYTDQYRDAVLEDMVRVNPYTGPTDTYDTGMILVVGGAQINYTIEKTEVSQNGASYHVTMHYTDGFDISRLDYSEKNYDKEDVKLANAISLLGKLMVVGGLFKEFFYEFQLGFDISFDNDCSHQTGNFRWEDNNAELKAVSGDSLTISNAERIDHYHPTTKEYLGYYFELDKTVRLKHDLPWVVEVKSNWVSWALGPTKNPTNGLPYLQKYSTVIAGAEGFPYKGISSTTGKEATLYGRNLYGVDFTEVGIKNYREHIWRLENRVSGGYNMVYLLVDGQEIGPMNQYHIYKDSTFTSQQKTEDWFNGTDIDINFIFNTYTVANSKYPVSYVQIWENGEGNASHSYYTTKTVAPTCTGKGYVSHICSQCGDIWNDTFVDALGHKLGTYTKKNDKLHSRTCTICGEEQVDVHELQNNACTLCDYSATRSVAGTWNTDLTMPAADLGVSAPDSVLRATLSFTNENSVTATWEAVDLTAFRLFFRDMFISSYYAMAYGAGITDINEIEAFCQQSTGMSVSAYMDTIVTDEAMKAAFTPANSQGSYRYNDTQTAIYTDLNFMGVSSDSSKENSFTTGGDTLYLNAASWDKPDYTFVCKK